MKNLYICRTDWGNPGDLWSTPLHYLSKKFQGPLCDSKNLRGLHDNFDNIVIGGGALFTSSKMISILENALEKISSTNLMIWGVSIDKNLNFKSLWDRAVVKGTRDWLPDTEFEHYWLPCASVLHPAIKNNLNHRATKDFLVVDHWKRDIIKFTATHTRATNNPCTIEDMIALIADHRYIITSSYHTAYWATLLNKHVIVVSKPWQPKFENFRHPPVLAEEFSWALLDLAKNYPDAYDQCRTANELLINTLSDYFTLPT